MTGRPVKRTLRDSAAQYAIHRPSGENFGDPWALPRVVQRLRRGAAIKQVRALVAIVHDPKSSCMHARDMAAEHLAAVRMKVCELKALERSLIAS